jgi:hypothetical protein
MQKKGAPFSSFIPAGEGIERRKNQDARSSSLSLGERRQRREVKRIYKNQQRTPKTYDINKRCNKTSAIIQRKAPSGEGLAKKHDGSRSGFVGTAT